MRLYQSEVCVGAHHWRKQAHKQLAMERSFIVVSGESMAQSKITRSLKPKLSRWSVVTEWMADRYVLGFAPILRFLRSQFTCRFYKSPSDETVNRGPPCVYTCKRITYARKHPVCYCFSSAVRRCTCVQTRFSNCWIHCFLLLLILLLLLLLLLFLEVGRACTWIDRVCTSSW